MIEKIQIPEVKTAFEVTAPCFFIMWAGYYAVTKDTIIFIGHKHISVIPNTPAGQYARNLESLHKHGEIIEANDFLKSVEVVNKDIKEAIKFIMDAQTAIDLTF